MSYLGARLFRLQLPAFNYKDVTRRRRFMEPWQHWSETSKTVWGR